MGYGYAKGTIHTTNKYEATLAKSEAQQEKAFNQLLKQKSKIEVQVVTEYVDKLVEVEKWKTKYVEVIKHVPDTSTVLSNGWVYAHDKSTSMYPGTIDSTRASDAAPSGITAPEALGGVINNYATCRKNAEQLVALQGWVDQISKLPKQQSGDCTCLSRKTRRVQFPSQAPQ